MRNLVNQAEYARIRGVSRNAVSQAVKSGRITLVDGKIDPEVADIQWKKNTDHNMAARAHGKRMTETEVAKAVLTETDQEDIAYWVKRKTKAEALSKEQDQQREAGNLYYKDTVDRGAKTIGRLVRDQILSVPSRLAAEIAVMSNAAEIEQRLRSELRSALLAVEERASAVIAEREGNGDEA